MSAPPGLLPPGRSQPPVVTVPLDGTIGMQPNRPWRNLPETTPDVFDAEVSTIFRGGGGPPAPQPGHHPDLSASTSQHVPSPIRPWTGSHSSPASGRGPATPESGLVLAGTTFGTPPRSSHVRSRSDGLSGGSHRSGYLSAGGLLSEGSPEDLGYSSAGPPSARSRSLNASSQPFRPSSGPHQSTSAAVGSARPLFGGWDPMPASLLGVSPEYKPLAPKRPDDDLDLAAIHAESRSEREALVDLVDEERLRAYDDSLGGGYPFLLSPNPHGGGSADEATPGTNERMMYRYIDQRIIGDTSPTPPSAPVSQSWREDGRGGGPLFYPDAPHSHSSHLDTRHSYPPSRSTSQGYMSDPSPHELPPYYSMRLPPGGHYAPYDDSPYVRYEPAPGAVGLPTRSRSFQGQARANGPIKSRMDTLEGAVAEMRLGNSQAMSSGGDPSHGRSWRTPSHSLRPVSNDGTQHDRSGEHPVRSASSGGASSGSSSSGAHRVDGTPPILPRPLSAPNVFASLGPPAQPAQQQYSDARSRGASSDSGGRMGADSSSQGGHKRLSDEEDSVRASLAESPTTRAQYKQFYKQFRTLERSYTDAKVFVSSNIHTLPVKIHWKVLLELADLAKRENRFAEARRLYREVTALQPYASQGWMEFSKMEEECGRLSRCRSILRQGLAYCKHNETLLSKSIKLEERFNDLPTARALLSQLRDVSLDKCWRTLLEGAQLEARACNTATARQVFKYLMSIVPWYGPIYLEALKFEERIGNYRKALAIVSRGVVSIPKYGPLWFGAFRLCEKLEAKYASKAACMKNRSVVPGFPVTRLMMEQAVNHISRELVWKVYFEAARLEERTWELCDVLYDEVCTDSGSVLSSPRSKEGLASPRDRESPLHPALYLLDILKPNLPPGVRLPPLIYATRDTVVTERDRCVTRFRKAYVLSSTHCPDNLRWKVWLSGARSELSAGNNDTAKCLLARAAEEVPSKSRAQVTLEMARLEEYCGDVPKARELLTAAREHSKQDWKVFLESVLLERRVGVNDAAEKLAKEALQLHPGTGRLWAILVQLRAYGGPHDQIRVFSHALSSVPKSGEVWAEGARLYMNPCSPYYDTVEAGRCLVFGLQFTPQYGDSFIEWLRLCLLVAAGFGTHDASLQDDEAVTIATRSGSKASSSGSSSARPAFRTYEDVVDISLQEFLEKVDTSGVEQKCMNADPNYGSMWFHCKTRPFDTARQVLKRAKAILCCEINLCRLKYATAAMKGRSKRLKSSCQSKPPLAPAVATLAATGTAAAAGSGSATVDSTDISEEEEGVTDLLEEKEGREAPPRPVIATAHMDYTTGFVSLSRDTVRATLITKDDRAELKAQKRKLLFGSDLIL